MKKRSLVAALAMLVVSAIVLTSSTYAWFASNSSAKVETLSADVSNNDGSLTVSADNTNFVAKIGPADYPGYRNLLNPVSMSINDEGAVSAYKVGYNSTEFTGAGAGSADADYLKYTYYVKYQNGSTSDAMNVTATTAFTSGAFCYGLVVVTVDDASTYYYFNDAAGNATITPITSITGSIIDADHDSVVDDAKNEADGNTFTTGAMTGAQEASTGDTLAIMSVPAAKTSPVVKTATVDVYVWAEGQDPECSGTASASSVGFNFVLNAVKA